MMAAKAASWTMDLGPWLCLLALGPLSAQQPQAPEGAHNVEREMEEAGLGIFLWELSWEMGSPPEQHVDFGPVLEIQNPYGAIRIQVENVGELRAMGLVGERLASSEEIAFAQNGARFQLLAQPEDDAPMDLAVTVPYGLMIQAATADGAIRYSGFGKADLQTDFGAVELEFPARATHFELITAEPPGAFEGRARVRKSQKAWTATDRLPRSRINWGPIRLNAQRPERIVIRDLGDIPADSPVKMHWQAEEVMATMFRRTGRSLKKRDRDPEPRPESSANFSADVRLTQLDVSVTDSDGRPVAGLGPEDFEVVEDGDSQTLQAVSSFDTPLNLALLLDCSDSTERDRWGMEQAAHGFVGVARERDRVAVYALANTLFQVLSTLTLDHEAAANGLGAIGLFGGATPLYDAIVLSYAEELARLPRERNALIVLTDGLENRIVRSTTGSVYTNSARPNVDKSQGVMDAPSRVSFMNLRKAAEEMRALIYPVILDPFVAATVRDPLLYEKARKWALTVNEQAGELAEATGGRVFHARSITDLDGVYEQVAEELRSIYTLSYRPTNGDFDGGWRRVRVKVKTPGAQVRTRPGYYAD